MENSSCTRWKPPWQSSNQSMSHAYIFNFPICMLWPMEKTTSLLILGKQLVCRSHDVSSVLQEKMCLPDIDSNVLFIASLRFMPWMITQSSRIALISFLCLSHPMSCTSSVSSSGSFLLWSYLFHCLFQPPQNQYVTV